MRANVTTNKRDRMAEVGASKRKRHHDGEGRQPTRGALLTTSEVARRMGLSRQRVIQLEASAFRKLSEVFPGLKELIP